MKRQPSKTRFFLLLGVMLVLCLILVACGKNNKTETPGTSPVTSTQDKPTDSSTALITSTLPQTTETPSPESTGTLNSKPAVGNPSVIGYPSSASDSLPTLSIKTDGGANIVSRDEYISAVISASGTLDDAVYGFTDRTTEVRCRGNYTYVATEKKSYRLKFTEKINLFGQGNGPAKSWVLLANHCDQSFLRNHIAFTIGRNLSNISYCSSSSFVHLYVNGEYQGIYQVAEQHQVNEYRVNIEENPNVVNTDYLIERDNYADEECVEGIDYFRVNRKKYRVHSDTMTEEKCKYLQKYFQDAHDAIVSGNRVSVERYLDIDSMIDTFILQAFTKNTDIGFSSFFMVKKANGKIYFTCPWDFDNSQGNDARLDNGNYEGLYVGIKSNMQQEHEWFYLLMNESWFCDRLLARWNEVKETLHAAVLFELDHILTSFEDDMAKNFEVWKIFTQGMNPQINQEPLAIRKLKTYKEHVLYLKDWLEKRYTYLDELFNSDELYRQGGYESQNGWWNDWGW